MKWANKGHELDSIGNKFKNIDNVYIYGANELGARLCASLEFLNCVTVFIDYDIKKQQAGFMGKQVISQRDFLKTQKDKCIVIITVQNQRSTNSIKRVLLSVGFEEGTNCFDYQMFSYFYLPIFALYRFQKLYINRLYMFITEHCTLKCEYCSAGIPSYKNPKHIDKSYIFENVNALFNCVEYLENLTLTGGEALVHPDIAEILEYILSKYIPKLGVLRIITNGNTKISDSLIQILKNPKIEVEWTNYIRHIENSKIIKNTNETIKRLNDAQIKIIELNGGYWEDVETKYNENTEKNQEELTDFYNNCAICAGGCAILWEKAILTCGATLKRDESGNLTALAHKDLLFLHSQDSNHKKIILEWYMGFTEKGYLETCRICNGRGIVNPHKVAVAKQL